MNFYNKFYLYIYLDLHLPSLNKVPNPTVEIRVSNLMHYNSNKRYKTFNTPHLALQNIPIIKKFTLRFKCITNDQDKGSTQLN